MQITYRLATIIIVSLFYTKFCLTCPSSNSTGCAVYTSKLLCNEEINITEGSSAILTIELCNLNRTVLYLGTLLNHFPNLNNLTILNGSIAKIEANSLMQHDHLQIIVINNINITTINEKIFGKLINLKILDLRNNSLESIHTEDVIYLMNLTEIYLSDNKWNCSENLNWINRLNKTIPDIRSLTCYGEPFDGKPLYYISEVKNLANNNCPNACKCFLSEVIHNSDIEELQPFVEVDCSGSNLTHLPEYLPQFTKILRLERNHISDISPLVKNDTYRGVTDLYIDHNLIHSIDILEGSHWLSNFRVLSLHGNKLTELPTYAMDNALQQNPNMPNAIMLYLGNNPWRCDCVFTPSFQEDILVQYESQIQDMKDIKCSYVHGDENSMSPIVQLSRSSICRLPNEYSIRALDLLNGILASLIVLVLGKLAYDYYYFKKTGKLPWIVTKMP